MNIILLVTLWVIIYTAGPEWDFSALKTFKQKVVDMLKRNVLL